MAKLVQVLIDGYPIDIARIERHEYSSEVTQRPVEKDGDVTDHVRNNPDVVTLECVVSDTPVGAIAQHETRLRDEVTQEVFGEATPLPSDDAYKRMLEIHRRRRPVTIVTSRDRFDNMVMKRLGIPCESSTTGGLTFEVEFVQVIIAVNRRVVVPVAVPRARSKSNLGALTAKDDIVNKQWLWRISRFPGGGPLEARFPWVIVTIKEFDNGQFGGSYDLYVFEGRQSGSSVGGRAAASTGTPAPPFKVVQYEVLGTVLTAWFLKDLKRDQDEKVKAFTDAENASRKKGFLTLDEKAELDAARRAQQGDRGLPAGMDLSRFTAPRSSTFPTTGPTTTFAPGTVK